MLRRSRYDVRGLWPFHNNRHWVKKISRWKETQKNFNLKDVEKNEALTKRPVRHCPFSLPLSLSVLAYLASRLEIFKEYMYSEYGGDYGVEMNGEKEISRKNFRWCVCKFFHFRLQCNAMINLCDRQNNWWRREKIAIN